MTPKEFYGRMLGLEELSKKDREVAHSKADDILCEALKSLGYEEGIEIFERMRKWYA